MSRKYLQLIFRKNYLTFKLLNCKNSWMQLKKSFLLVFLNIEDRNQQCHQVIYIHDPVEQAVDLTKYIPGCGKILSHYLL